MKKISLIIGAMLLMIGAAQAAASPIGNWEVTTGEARYKVFNCGKSLCLSLTWLREDAKTQANKELVNKIVAVGVPKGELSWTGVVRYEGQKYQGEMSLTSENTMRVSACSGMFCKSYSLKRI